MTTENTQPAVDAAKTEATPSVPANDAQKGDDLDALLAQFQTETTKTPPPPPQTEAATPDVKALLAEVNTLKSQVAEVGSMKFKQDINETVKNIKGDLDLDDEIVEAWLDAKARTDSRLQSAWMQRDNKPEQWKQVRAGLAKSLASKFSRQPDRALTEDREAVASAVRGASTKAPVEQQADYSRMTNAELRKEFQEKYGFSPPF